LSIRDIVYAQIKIVAEQQRKNLPPLTDAMGIQDSGFDSLCLALLVANLEDELNVSPFDTDDSVMPTTYGDLIQAYENAVTSA
jgi:acyl carrier protein